MFYQTTSPLYPYKWLSAPKILVHQKNLKKKFVLYNWKLNFLMSQKKRVEKPIAYHKYRYHKIEKMTL